jgi:hypothetical protein
MFKPTRIRFTSNIITKRFVRIGSKQAKKTNEKPHNVDKINKICEKLHNVNKICDKPHNFNEINGINVIDKMYGNKGKRDNIFCESLMGAIVIDVLLVSIVVFAAAWTASDILENIRQEELRLKQEEQKLKQM